MRIELGKIKGEIARFQQEIAALEQELTARKNAMLAKLAELLGMGGAPEAAPIAKKPGRKPGRKPGAKAARGKAMVDKAGRIHGEETLPQMIVKILRQTNRPLNAGEIFERLQKLGWKTVSDHPQIFVYKTLHRIEKMGVIVRAERGRYKAPK